MSKSRKRKGKNKDKQKAGRQADTADRHHYYELAVLAADAEVDFVDETFANVRGRNARLLREDFCGTANVCCEWVRRRPDNRAIGVDFDADVLDWGRAHHLARLKDAARTRVQLLNADVTTVATQPADIILAMNFSYWTFKDRTTLQAYFQQVRESLAVDGMLFLDAYGGYEAYQVLEEATEHDDFTYVWDQAAYNPVNGDIVCHIHFKFPDGSKIKRAFTYEWRLWSLPEIRELLVEAGFSSNTVYWEGYDEDTDEGNGEFTPAEEGEPDAGWIAYVVAEK